MTKTNGKKETNWKGFLLFGVIGLKKPSIMEKIRNIVQLMD